MVTPSNNGHPSRKRSNAGEVGGQQPDRKRGRISPEETNKEGHVAAVIPIESNPTNDTDQGGSSSKVATMDSTLSPQGRCKKDAKPQAVPAADAPRQAAAVNKAKEPPLRPSTMVAIIGELNNLITEHKSLRDFFLSDKPPITVTEGEEEVRQWEATNDQTTDPISQAHTWKQIAKLKDDFTTHEATSFDIEKVIVRLGDKAFHTTATKKRENLDVVDDYLTDKDGRLSLPIDRLPFENGGTKTYIELPTVIASCYFAIQASLESNANIVGRFDVSRSSKRYKQLLSANLGVNQKLCIPYDQKFKNLPPEVVKWIQQISLGPIGLYNKNGYDEPSTTSQRTSGDSKTDRDNSKDANHGGEGGRVDVALPQKLPPPDVAATDGSDTENDTSVLSLVLQRLSGSELRSITTKLPGILVDAKTTERDLLPLSLARNPQLKQDLNAPDVEQEESAECALPPSPALRARAGPTEADDTNSLKDSDVLSELLQLKKESSTDPKSKAPDVISTLKPKLRDAALTAGVLELALDRIVDWERIAKSRQQRIRQLEPKTGAKKVTRGPHRQIKVNSSIPPGEYFLPPAAGGPLPFPPRSPSCFRSPGHTPSGNRPPPAAGGPPTHSPGSPSRIRSPPPVARRPFSGVFSSPGSVAPYIPPRTDVTRSLTGMASELYDLWGPAMWGDAVPDEPRVVQLAGDMRVNLERCVHHYMLFHELKPTTSLGQNVMKLEPHLDGKHWNALAYFKRDLDDALHSECPTPSRPELSESADKFLWWDYDFWMWVQQQPS